MHTHIHTFPAFRTSLRERRECGMSPLPSSETTPTVETAPTTTRPVESLTPATAGEKISADSKKVANDLQKIGIDLKNPAHQALVAKALEAWKKPDSAEHTNAATEVAKAKDADGIHYDVVGRDEDHDLVSTALDEHKAAPAETAAPKLDAAGLKAKNIDVTKADWQALLRTAIAGGKKENPAERTPKEKKALEDIKTKNGVDLTDPKVRAEVENTLKGVPQESGNVLDADVQRKMEKDAKEQQEKARTALMKEGGGAIARPGGKLSPQERMAVGQIMMSTGVSMNNLDSPPSAPNAQWEALINRFVGLSWVISSVVERVKGKGGAVETKPLSGPEKAREDNKRQGIEMLKGKGLVQDPNDETKFTLTADKAKFGGVQDGKALQFQFNKTSAQWEWKSDGGDWELAGKTPYKLAGIAGPALELRKEWNKVGADLGEGNLRVTEATEKPEEGAERRGVALLLAEKGKDGAAAVVETKEGGVRIFTVKETAFGGKQEGQKLQFKFDAAAKQWQWKGADEAAWSPAGKAKYDNSNTETLNPENIALREKWNGMSDKLAGENVKAKPEATKKLEAAEGNAAKKLIENGKKAIDKVTISGAEKERILAKLAEMEGSTSPDKLQEVRKILAPVFIAAGRTLLASKGREAPEEGENAFRKHHGYLGWRPDWFNQSNWHFYKFDDATSQWHMKIGRSGRYGEVAAKASEWDNSSVDVGHRQIARELLKINDMQM